MTLAVALAVPEGLVIGADSRTSYFNSQKWPRVASDYARKVFPLSAQSVAATYGWAFLNGRSIAAIVAEFAASTDLASAPPNVVTAKLGAHFQEQYEKHISAGSDSPVANGEAFGFIVAVTDSDGIGHLYNCDLPGPLVTRVGDTKGCGATWRGDIGVVVRLIKGRDLSLNPTTMPSPYDSLIPSLEYIVRFPNFTLQDAIDFIVFLVKATAEMLRFSDGTGASPGAFPTVGGPIDIAVLQPKGIPGYKANHSSASAPRQLSAPHHSEAAWRHDTMPRQTEQEPHEIEAEKPLLCVSARPPLYEGRTLVSNA